MASEPPSEPPNEPPRGDSPRGQADNDDDHTKALSAINETLVAFKGDHKANTEQHAERDERRFRRERGIFYGIVAYTLATIVLVFINANQLKALWTQVGDSHKQVATSVDNERRQLRAYVGIFPIYIYAFDDKTPVDIRLSMANHGQTPASTVIDNGRIDILPYPLPHNFDFPPLHDIPAPSRSVIFPNDTFWARLKADRAFTQEEIDAVVVGDKKRIYVYGIVTYDDAFGKSHETSFCRSVVGGGYLKAVSEHEIASGMDYETCDQHESAT